MQTDQCAKVFDLVYKAYESFDADNEEGRQQLATIRRNMKEWFRASPRFVSEAGQYCIRTFVGEELAHGEPQRDFPAALQSLGQENFLGQRHAKLLARRPSDDLSLLTRLVNYHLTCGYLFSEFGYGQTERLSKRNADELYKIWMPLTLSKMLARCDPQSKDEADIQGIWMKCTAQPIVNLIERWGVKWDRADNWILTRYFYAGRILRWLESVRLTDEEVKQFYAAAF